MPRCTHSQKHKSIDYRKLMHTIHFSALHSAPTASTSNYSASAAASGLTKRDGVATILPQACLSRHRSACSYYQHPPIHHLERSHQQQPWWTAASAIARQTSCPSIRRKPRPRTFSRTQLHHKLPYFSSNSSIE